MVSKCKYCGREIHWQNITGLWVPFEDKACTVRHACRKVTEAVTSEESKARPQELSRPEPFTPEEVQVLRRFVQFMKG